MTICSFKYTGNTLSLARGKIDDLSSASGKAVRRGLKFETFKPSSSKRILRGVNKKQDQSLDSVIETKTPQHLNKQALQSPAEDERLSARTRSFRKDSGKMLQKAIAASQLKSGVPSELGQRLEYKPGETLKDEHIQIPLSLDKLKQLQNMNKKEDME